MGWLGAVLWQPLHAVSNGLRLIIAGRGMLYLGGHDVRGIECCRLASSLVRSGPFRKGPFVSLPKGGSYVGP